MRCLDISASLAQCRYECVRGFPFSFFKLKNLCIPVTLPLCPSWSRISQSPAPAADRVPRRVIARPLEGAAPPSRTREAAQAGLTRGTRHLAAGLAPGDSGCFTLSCSTPKVDAGRKQVKQAGPRAAFAWFRTNAGDGAGASESERLSR